MNQSKIWLPSWEMEKVRKEAFDTNWIAPLGANVNGLESDLESYLKIVQCRRLKFRNSCDPFGVNFIRSRSG
jgi:hypothetical protein